MADRVSARITIGGTLPRPLLDEFIQIVGDENLGLDWDGASFASMDIPADKPVELMAHEVAGGSFDRLESFCSHHGLSYVRWSGGCPGSFGPQRVVFTGSGEPESYAVTEDDELVFDLDTIRKLGRLAAVEARAAESDFEPGPLTIVDDLPHRATEADHG